MECDVCKNSGTKDQPIVICDGCKKRLCKQCGHLSSSEIKVLGLKERVMKFFCKDCLDVQTIELLQKVIETKNSLIEAKEKIIELMEQKLHESKQKLEDVQNRENAKTLPSYSSALVLNIQKNNCEKNIPCLIIKPNSLQDCSKTKAEVERHIDPIKLSVGINSIKNGRNGSLLLNCNSKSSNEKIINEVNNKLGRNYTIQESKLRKPSITIANISKDVEENEIIPAIMNQNNFLTENDHIELKLLKQTRRGDSKFAIIDCNGLSFNKIMSAKKINIKFNRCPVYENINITQCYKCNFFNHKATNCKKESFVCGKCSENHPTRECQNSAKRCVNCTTSNQKYKSVYDSQHESYDKDCPVYKKQLENLKRRTDYNFM